MINKSKSCTFDFVKAINRFKGPFKPLLTSLVFPVLIMELSFWTNAIMKAGNPFMAWKPLKCKKNTNYNYMYSLGIHYHIYVSKAWLAIPFNDVDISTLSTLS